MSRAIHPAIIEAVQHETLCSEADARRIIHAVRTAEAQVNASAIKELEGLLPWLKSLHRLHPSPSHLELNLAHLSVRVAMELLKA